MAAWRSWVLVLALLAVNLAPARSAPPKAELSAAAQANRKIFDPNRHIGEMEEFVELLKELRDMPKDRIKQISEFKEEIRNLEETLRKVKTEAQQSFEDVKGTLAEAQKLEKDMKNDIKTLKEAIENDVVKKIERANSRPWMFPLFGLAVMVCIAGLLGSRKYQKLMKSSYLD
mmetsp:Transcript_31734/g.100821  ORF Transcript_31734/g.100821 Transcript_31734/m.100821 type:complete len:173 (-) Transcript_31734:587-1105(-)